MAMKKSAIEDPFIKPKKAKSVVKVQPKGAVKKSAVKNPSAPKPAGSGTSVKVITKSETAMKKGTAGRNRSGIKSGGTELDYRRGMYITGPGKSTKYVTGQDNSLKGVPLKYDALKAQDKKMKSTQSSSGKPSQKITPKKKAVAPKPKPKRRLYIGRGGGMRGGVGGTLDSQIK
jgi:hypothetical protein